MKWPEVELGDIFNIARGGSPRPIQDFITEDGDGVNWIMISDASGSSKYIRETKKKIRPEGVSKSRMVYPGDFLLTNSMSFGRPYVMQTEGCIHDGWLVMSSNENQIDSDYFYQLLSSEFMYRRFSKKAAGATVKNLNIELVKGVKVNLPPIAEQKRIAAILDKADAIRRKRQQALKLTDDFLRSTFLKMFGDPVTNPMGWEVKSLQSLGLVKTGKTPSSKVTGSFEGLIPFVTPGDLAESWTSAKRTVTEIGAAQCKVVRKGASFVCCIGATIGKMGKASQESCFNQQINAVEWHDESMDDFGLECLKFLKTKIADLGSSTTLPILNKGNFQTIEIPYPDQSLRKSFSKLVRDEDARRKLQIKLVEQSETLFKSLQQRAFSGQL